MAGEKGTNYVVRQGDCIYSIAAKYGFRWKTIWEHSANSELKTRRKDPNILHPGDIVFVPPKELKQKDCGTENKHTFVCQTNLTKLHLEILENEEPRSDERYILQIDGRFFEGKTKADGSLEHLISPIAKKGKLTLSPGEKKEQVYDLQLGGLDPKDEISGVQARLFNLGFPVEVNGKTDAQTIEVLRLFQAKYKLAVSGQIDDATTDKLKELYGC